MIYENTIVVPKVIVVLLQVWWQQAAMVVCVLRRTRRLHCWRLPPLLRWRRTHLRHRSGESDNKKHGLFDASLCCLEAGHSIAASQFIFCREKTATSVEASLMFLGQTARPLAVVLFHQESKSSWRHASNVCRGSPVCDCLSILLCFEDTHLSQCPW